MNKEHFQISSGEATASASKHMSEARYHRFQEAITGYIGIASGISAAYLALEEVLEKSNDGSTIAGFALGTISCVSLVLSRNQNSKANFHEQTAANLHSHAEINQL